MTPHKQEGGEEIPSFERHNAATRPILQHIVQLIGPDPRSLLVFAENLIVGLFLVIVRLGGDEPVLAVFMDGVSKRLAELRLGNLDAGAPQ